MADFNIDLLRVFVAIAEEGSFTGGARRLYRTQSTVSLQLKRLERQIGCRLLKRTQGRVNGLTPAGETLLTYALDLIQLSDKASEALKNESLTGSVHLGLSDEASHQDLSLALARFQSLHPQVQVQVTCASSGELEEWIQIGRIDLALVNRWEEKIAPAGIEIQWLYRDALAWAFHQEVFWENPDPVPLICFPEGCAYRARAIQALEASHIRWRTVYTSASRQGVWSAVTSGLGVAALPRRDIVNDIKAVQMGKHGKLPCIAPVEVVLLSRDDHKENSLLCSLSAHIKRRFAARANAPGGGS